MERLLCLVHSRLVALSLITVDWISGALQLLNVPFETRREDSLEWLIRRDGTLVL